MAKKKSGAEDRAAKAAKRRLRRWVKSLHPVIKALCVVCLLAGIAGGALYCLATFKNDRFVLCGTTQFSLDVGAEGSTYLYEEEGVDAVCFGRDVSGKLTVQTDLEQDAQGRYIIPTDKEGVYTITYTVDCIKFGENAPNGVIKRIRVFTVCAAEEDGRGGE
jgi:hypothetical protein